MAGQAKDIESGPNPLKNSIMVKQIQKLEWMGKRGVLGVHVLEEIYIKKVKDEKWLYLTE